MLVIRLEEAMLHLLEDSEFRHEDVAFVGGDSGG